MITPYTSVTKYYPTSSVTSIFFMNVDVTSVVQVSTWLVKSHRKNSKSKIKGK